MFLPPFSILRSLSQVVYYYLDKVQFLFLDIIFSYLSKGIKICDRFFFLYLCFGSFMTSVDFTVRDFSQMLGHSWLSTRVFERNVSLLVRNIALVAQTEGVS